jgi:hypothetical protein
LHEFEKEGTSDGFAKGKKGELMGAGEPLRSKFRLLPEFLLSRCFFACFFTSKQ